MVATVGGIAEAAELAGVRPSVLLDRLLCALEDEARGDVHYSTEVHQGRNGDVSLSAEVALD